MEERMIEIIRELGEYEEDDVIEANAKVDKYLDDLGLDDLSFAIEEEYGIIIDPEDMVGKKITAIVQMVEEEL